MFTYGLWDKAGCKACGQWVITFALNWSFFRSLCPMLDTDTFDCLAGSSTMQVVARSRQTIALDVRRLVSEELLKASASFLT
jgi:hypothetical protein